MKPLRKSACTSGHINDDVESVSLTDKEKFKIIMPILNNIGTLISCHSTNTFLRYVEEFKNAENKVRRGKSIAVQEISTHPQDPSEDHHQSEPIPTSVVVTGDPLTAVVLPPAVPRLSQVTRVTMGTRAPLLFRLTGVPLCLSYFYK